MFGGICPCEGSKYRRGHETSLRDGGRRRGFGPYEPADKSTSITFDRQSAENQQPISSPVAPPPDCSQYGLWCQFATSTAHRMRTKSQSALLEVSSFPVLSSEMWFRSFLSPSSTKLLFSLGLSQEHLARSSNKQRSTHNAQPTTHHIATHTHPQIRTYRASECISLKPNSCSAPQIATRTTPTP